MTQGHHDRDDLNQIATSWALLRDAHGGSTQAAARARDLLARRYQRAVTAYLRRIGCPDDLADEVTQQFFLALCKGELRSADPRKGSFRTLVKVVLRRLLGKERLAAGRRPRPVEPNGP